MIHSGGVEENLQKLLKESEVVALAGCIHFGPEGLVDGLPPTKTQIAASICVPRAENKTCDPARGPCLTFSALWGSEKSGTVS